MKVLKIVISILLLLMSGCSVKQFITEESPRNKSDTSIYFGIFITLLLAIICIWI